MHQDLKKADALPAAADRLILPYFTASLVWGVISSGHWLIACLCRGMATDGVGRLGEGVVRSFLNSTSGMTSNHAVRRRIHDKLVVIR